MKFEFKPRAISKKDFFSIKEDDLMLITNHGRMGDENGSTFLIQKDNQNILYEREKRLQNCSRFITKLY